MRYFDTSAVHHHADEGAGPVSSADRVDGGFDAVCVHELTDSLAAEHRELEQRWRALHLRLEHVTRADAVTLPDDEVHGFIALYKRHIAREEAELLPMAGRLLSDAELDRIGLAMRARRGAIEAIQPPIPPLPDALRRPPSLIGQGVVMTQPHLHLSPDAIYPFDASGVAKRFRHAAILGALDSLRAGESMRFSNDRDPLPLPLLSQMAQRYGNRISVEYHQREPGAIVIDFSVR